MLNPEVIGTYHGYVCRYTPTIMSGPVYRWSVGGRDVLSASRDGLCFHTNDVYPPGQLARLLALVELAREVSERLCRLRGTEPVDAISAFIRDYKG